MSGYRPSFEPLTNKEIEAFFADLDKDGDGVMSLEEMTQRLEEVHEELAPVPSKHHLHHPARRGVATEKSDLEGTSQHDGMYKFLKHIMPDCGVELNKDVFTSHVRQWNVPSQSQASSEEEDAKDVAYEHRLSLRRRLRAWWATTGPKVLFIMFVIGLQLGLGIWQLVKYLNATEVRAALGWGVVLAKTCAGVLYPTLFFMILSMSRYFATYMRRFYYISKWANWDRHQSFHIWMALVALFFASLHAIGHLTGSFLYGSRPSHQDALAVLLGPESVPKPYIGFVRTLPGWTGITALGLFWVITILSMPWIRNRSYEIFQLGHLLMFPMIGLLCAHGTAQLLQYSMLGYWLAFPTILVIIERSVRVARGFLRVPARMEILDDDTVAFSCKHPRGKNWRYEAGQYIFLQVPELSFFQWHPFTISACVGNRLQVHIKTDGDWTGRLRDLPTDRDVFVGIDGPFGAPAQRFYDFDRSLIIGSGVGITPFSAILTDLEQRISSHPESSMKNSRDSTDVSALAAESSSDADIPKNEAGAINLKPDGSLPRRVDFHWMVRERNYLLWFSSLLNRAHELSTSVPRSRLDLNIHTHITMKRKNISTHVFRYLLDQYRTKDVPYSALTGLRVRSLFGRPDLDAILLDFHEDMRKQGWTGGKVGVFFCGSPVIGRVLSDACEELTLRGRHDGTKISYKFMMEVFG